MRKILLTTTAALILGLGAAHAQTQKLIPEGGGDAASPQSGPSTGGSSSGPAMKPQPGSGAAQAPSGAEKLRNQAQDLKRPGTAEVPGVKPDTKLQQQGQDATSPATDQKRSSEKMPKPGEERSGSTAEKGSTELKGSAQQKTDADKSGTRVQGQSKQGVDVEQRGSAGVRGSADTETTGSVNTNVNISTEQRQTIKQTIVSQKVQPVRDVNFTVSVGEAIPRTIELHRLPPRVVEIVPQYKGYMFFMLADGRIVIVEPSSYEIVYIITA